MRAPRSAQHVVVSAATLSADRVTGIERYTVELLAALIDTCPDHRVLTIVGPRWLTGRIAAHVHAPPRRLPRPVANEIWLPAVLRRHRCDVLHTVAYGPPLLARPPWVATVHDLVPWEHPETLGRAGRWYLSPSMKINLRLRRREMIITPAESTSASLRGAFPGATVVTVPEGVSSGFSPGAPASAGPPWRLLAVGTIEPRKGLGTLAAAVERLTTRGVVLSARVAGRRGWGAPLPPPLVELGYLADDALAREYRQAHLLVAGSDMEGFDLPVLEAMACGLPVVASDIPVHREYFAEAARLVPPRDPDALADAIGQLLTAPDERHRLRSLGLTAAQRFSWPVAARQVHAVYDSLMAA